MTRPWHPYDPAHSPAMVKRLRKELREMLQRHTYSHAVTLALNEPGTSTERARRLLKAWDARVNSDLLGPRWHKKPDERVLWYAFLESPRQNPHWHILAEVCPDRPRSKEWIDRFPTASTIAWWSVSRSGSLDVQSCNSWAAIKYTTKDLIDNMSYECFVSHMEFVRK
jgi:hypothetical protein